MYEASQPGTHDSINWIGAHILAFNRQFVYESATADARHDVDDDNVIRHIVAISVMECLFMNEHKRHHTCIIFIHHCHSSRATQESTRSDHIIDLEVISGHVNSARVHLYTASYF